WYHGHLSGPNAEKLLTVRDEPGTFLVRESLSKPGDFVLSVLTDEISKSGSKRVSHIKIMCQNDRYTVGGSDLFDTLTELVEFYKRKGIEEISGNWVYLRQPYFSTRVNAADIDSRVKQLDLTLNKPSEVNDTRVILQNADPEVVGSDYINANYVKDKLWESGGQKVYIATQGCLATTVNDFWQMVWQEKTHVIVMTTREVEKGREPGGVLSFLTQVNTKQAEYPDAGPMIIHCRYSAAKPLKSNVTMHDFIECSMFCYKAYPSRSRVNSAGIGRTGTILVIDMIIETIDTLGLDCDIDISKYIQMVREQRSGMVQTEAQYKFIYLAVSEYIQTTKAKENASKETDTEYGNLQLKHQPASRKVSK
ncbi:hypothetical protein GOODEAATRI_020189, partial [Goodea atripinnis]